MTALPHTLEPASEQPLRLVMTTKPANNDRLDGAWWPYSTDATLELPSLLPAITARFGRTRAVMLNPATWQASPQWLLWGSRRARIAWYRHQDPNIAILLGENDKRIDLLVIPPNTEPRQALSAIDLASAHGNKLTASETLDIAREIGIARPA
jgi:hypothetical protein